MLTGCGVRAPLRAGGLAEQGAAVIDGAADILGDWGWVQRRADRKSQAVKMSGCLDTGKQLARALEEELAGHIVCRSGRVFERDMHGK